MTLQSTSDPASAQQEGRGSQRALREWANRVRAEYRSAAITARVLHLGIAAGLPRPLLDTARRVVDDELTHAELSHACLVALGGADVPVEVEFDALARLDHAEGPLAELVSHVLHSFCLGETFAVPLFRQMRNHTTLPSAHAALERILTDEAVHRAFGWHALDALLKFDNQGVRAFVETHLPAAIAAYYDAYAAHADAPPLTPEEAAAGLLDGVTYARIFHETWQNDIVPRFARRAIATPPDRW